MPGCKPGPSTVQRGHRMKYRRSRQTLPASPFRHPWPESFPPFLLVANQSCTSQALTNDHSPPDRPSTPNHVQVTSSGTSLLLQGDDASFSRITKSLI